MAYKIIISPQAQIEIEDAFHYYLGKSEIAPSEFITDIEDAYMTLSVNPFYRIRYRNLRALPLKRFPFIIIYLIEENTVIVKACFHTSKDISKYPK